MDEYTFNELERRVTELECQLDEDPPAKWTNESIISQLGKLQAKLNKAYHKFQELQKVKQISSRLQVWDAIDNNLSNTEDNATKSKTSKDEILTEEEMTKEEKKQLLLLKYTSIKEIFNEIGQLASNDFSKAINYLDSEPDGIHNFNEDIYEVLAWKDLLQCLACAFHALSLKSVIVMENYMEMVARNNRWLLLIEDGISSTHKKLASYEEEIKDLTKY